MDLNKILKIIVAIAILIIAVSVSYYFAIFLPQQKRVELELQSSEKRYQEQLIAYKREFAKECEIKYEHILNEMGSFYPTLIDMLKNSAEAKCKESDYFDIDSLWFCSNKVSYAHTRESFVPLCINWKLKQIGL